jgi:hypothetical protein
VNLTSLSFDSRQTSLYQELLHFAWFSFQRSQRCARPPSSWRSHDLQSGLEKRFFPVLMSYQDYASYKRRHLWPKPSNRERRNPRETHRLAREGAQRTRRQIRDGDELPLRRLPHSANVTAAFAGRPRYCNRAADINHSINCP